MVSTYADLAQRAKLCAVALQALGVRCVLCGLGGGVPGGRGGPPAGHAQRNQTNPTAGGPRQILTSEIRLTPLSRTKIAHMQTWRRGPSCVQWHCRRWGSGTLADVQCSLVWVMFGICTWEAPADGTSHESTT